MTNRELAEVLDCSPSMASRVRNGHRLPSTGGIMRIHERLGVPLADLMEAHTAGAEEFGLLVARVVGKSV